MYEGKLEHAFSTLLKNCEKKFKKSVAFLKTLIYNDSCVRETGQVNTRH